MRINTNAFAKAFAKQETTMPTSPAPQGRKKSYDPAFIGYAINMLETRGEAVTTSAVITAMHDVFNVPIVLKNTY